MKKVIKLELDFNHTAKTAQPVYCPVTGKLLVSADHTEPFEEDNPPESVVMYWAADYYEEPFFISDDFEHHRSVFSDLDSISGIEPRLKNLDDNHCYLILSVWSYGKILGDAGGLVFVLRLPNAWDTTDKTKKSPKKKTKLKL
jgi:hypothetical protein